MGYIASIGVGEAPNEFRQEEVKSIVRNLFQHAETNVERLLSIFDNAKIDRRQFVVDEAWLKLAHSFKEKNTLYIQFAKELSLKAIDHCLNNEKFLSKPIPYEAIDCIIFTTSTGIATPTVDARLLNEHFFKENIVRIPLWGLGCAGGASSLALATNWLNSNKEKVILIVCCELCSLAFQKEDDSVKNIVGTAIFGDGVAAALLVGDESTYLQHVKERRLRVDKTDSLTKKGTLSVMGWDVTDGGFEVIFSKQIPQLISSMWQQHFEAFVKNNNISLKTLSAVLAHPGGRKVLEEMERIVQNETLLVHSYEVLRNHGNMSAATVLYVLKRWYEKLIAERASSTEAILCALGPGFTSELLLLKWG